jgi:hypothetical protein
LVVSEILGDTALFEKGPGLRRFRKGDDICPCDKKSSKERTTDRVAGASASTSLAHICFVSADLSAFLRNFAVSSRFSEWLWEAKSRMRPSFALL